MTKTRIFTSVLLSAALVAGLATPAAASSSSSVNSRKVMVADLNLSSEAGARELLRRIDRAAHRVCYGPSGFDVLQSQTRRFKGCVREASSRAVADVGNSIVTALYEGRTSVEIAAK